MDQPSVTIALALAVGVIAQVAARHLNIPGIVLLLALGIVLGPEFAGFIDPGTFGTGLNSVVGFAVAVVLFEGALNLDVRRMRSQAKVIRRLVSVGALVTILGAASLTYVVLGWDLRQCFLFGTLVMVTGPTVITPLLRRIGVNTKLETILEAEGVFIDGIGAIVAVVALEAATFQYGNLPILSAVGQLGLRLATGLAVGAVVGAVLAWAIRRERLISDSLENVFVLASVLALFELSNVLMHEMGIVAVIAAGVTLGNLANLRQLSEFKEQLSVLLIGMLFILLAADVRLDDVVALGGPAIIVVLGLIFAVRPLAVAASSVGADLSRNEFIFLSWLAPRGIVAAAVASIFVDSMRAANQSGGEQLRALVFVVIGVTVVVQGLSGRWLATRLDLRRVTGDGWLILGANALSRAIGAILESKGDSVVFVDSNPEACAETESAGFTVVYGDGLRPRTLHRGAVRSRRAGLGLTANQEINLLFARAVSREAKDVETLVALHRYRSGIEERHVGEEGAGVLFGGPTDLDRWIRAFDRNAARVMVFTPPDNVEGGSLDESDSLPDLHGFLALVVETGKNHRPYAAREDLAGVGCIWAGVDDEGGEQAIRWFEECGWTAKDAELRSSAAG